jgi:ketosteroid isomerase-like protein
VTAGFIAWAALLALSACATTPPPTTMPANNDAEIRQAERALEIALSSTDPLAWVEHYTEDAVFVAPGAPAVQGREALTRMARSMRALSSVRIEPLRTESSGTVAAVYGRGSWVSGAGTPSPSTTSVRLIIVWRKESDGRWRVAQELLHAEPPAR